MKGLKLTARGEMVADFAAFVFCIIAVGAWSAVAYYVHMLGA